MDIELRVRRIQWRWHTLTIREKQNFFVNCSVPENFQWENFLGQVPTESLRTQDSENVYERWVQQIFDPVLPARSWEMPVKCELPAKIGRCLPKPFGHNFHISALKLNQRYFDIYEISLIQFQGWNLKIVAVRFFVTPPYFCWQLAFYRHLPTSGRQNRVKNLLYPPFIYIFWILSA